jgi:6-phosphogluconate dehydrogenase (decarboxylating)
MQIGVIGLGRRGGKKVLSAMRLGFGGHVGPPRK